MYESHSKWWNSCLALATYATPQEWEKEKRRLRGEGVRSSLLILDKMAGCRIQESKKEASPDTLRIKNPGQVVQIFS